MTSLTLSFLPSAARRTDRRVHKLQLLPYAGNCKLVHQTGQAGAPGQRP